MSIRTEVEKLKDDDLWSLLLFVLANIKEAPEYQGISELAFLLDRKSMFKLCEYYGGCTIKVPTIDELESLVYGLLMYEYIDIEKQSEEAALQLIRGNTTNITAVKQCYARMKSILSQYTFTSRSRQ